MTASTESTFYSAQKTAASLYAHQTYVPPPSEPKHDRQLYIGNIPFGISCTKLVEELNLALLAMGKHSCQLGNPILSCWISQDGHFAFLEFRTVADVHEGFALGQISLMGQPLKVGRTKIQMLQQQHNQVTQNSVAASTFC